MSTLDMLRNRTDFSWRKCTPGPRRTNPRRWLATLTAGSLLLLSMQGCSSTADADLTPNQVSGPETFVGASYEDAAFVDYITQNDCYRAEPGNYIKCDSTGVSFLMEGGRVKAVFGANG